MAKIRKIYDQTIKPDGKKTTIYPITSTRAVYTPEGETLDSYLKDGYFHGADLRGYKTVSNVTDLPTTENQFGWLIGEDLYVWVGTGGNALGGLYQNCGHFRTPYVPDDEDLVADSNNELKLKDRTVEDGGMGYVILRKNKTFAEQVTEENTIYEIRYDFVLTEDVTIPANCVLMFKGGSMSGPYTLNGQKTKVDADIVEIFGTDVLFSGTWDVATAFPEWFGAIGDGATDDTSAIQSALNLGKNVELINNHLILNITIPQKTKMFSTRSSILKYKKVTLIGDGICVSGIVFDGNMSCSGMEILGNDAIVERCKFLNTKADASEDGLTKAISFGNYYKEQDGITYKNIIVCGCVFDTAEPYNTNWTDTSTNSTTARFIHSYSAKNVQIIGNIFKGLTGLVDSDCIHLRALKENDASFPFTSTTNSQGTANPYTGKRYECIYATVSENTFFLNDTKSAIKVFGGDVVVSKNTFISKHSNSSHPQYGIVRCYNSKNVIVSENAISIDDTISIESSIEFEGIKGGLIANNTISSIGSVEMFTAFKLRVSDNIRVENNVIDIKCTQMRVCSSETNGLVVFDSNSICVDYPADTQKTIQFFVPWENRFIYPSNVDNGELLIISRNTFFGKGYAEDLSFVNQTEKSYKIFNNNIQIVGCVSVGISLIPTPSGSVNIELDDVVPFSDVLIDKNSTYNTGDIFATIKRYVCGQMDLRNLVSVKLFDCVFKNIISNFYLKISNGIALEGNNITFLGYDTQLRNESGAGTMRFSNLYSDSDFPRIYVPSGSLTVSVDSAKDGVPKLTRGTAANKPTLVVLPIGFKYWETDNNRFVYVSSSSPLSWVDATGATV